MEIFILLYVTYDYYRFQEFVSSHKTITSAYFEASSENIPVYVYNDDEEEDLQMALNDKEQTHYRIIKSVLK